MPEGTPGTHPNLWTLARAAGVFDSRRRPAREPPRSDPVTARARARLPCHRTLGGPKGSVAGSNDTLASITKAEVARLAKGGVTVAANRAATVAGDPAKRLELKFQSAGKAYWAVKYIVVHKDVVYTLSWVDLAGRRAALDKVATEMVASFQPVF